jgi:hypothetical protein
MSARSADAVRPRRVPAALVLLLVAVLGGCVGAPTDGPVREGLPAAEAEAPSLLVRPLARPPTDGMTPQEIVQGFLDASAAVGEEDTARAYLTRQAAQQWRPSDGITVLEADNPAVERSGADVLVSGRQVGSVSSSGVWREQQPTAVALPFPMAQVEGQWRISAPPAGLVLSRASLNRGFRVLPVMFLDPARSIAVPDPRYMPGTAPPGLATALLTALLAGPSPWLAPAVVSVFPPGAALAAGAVPVRDGIATVDVLGMGADLDDATREGVAAQLRWTLRTVPGVTAVVFSVDGREVPLGEGRGPLPLAGPADFDPGGLSGRADLYGIAADGQASVLRDGRLEPLLPGRPEGAATAVAVSPSGGRMALVPPDRSAVLLGALPRPEGPLVRVPASVAAGPRFDRQRRVWWVAADGSVVRALDGPAGTAPPVPAAVPVSVVAADGASAGGRPAPPGRIVAAVPARDGVRMLLLVAPPSGPTTAWLGVVVDGPQGTAVLGARPLPATAGAVAIAWHDSGTVTTLAAAQAAVLRWNLLGQPAGRLAITPAAAAVAVADAPAASPVVGLADGTSGTAVGDALRGLVPLSAPVFPG